MAKSLTIVLGLLLLVGFVSCQADGPLWDIVDGCLADVGLTRDDVEQFRNRHVCRFSNQVMNCLLTNLTECLPLQGTTLRIQVFIYTFSNVFCNRDPGVLQFLKPGICPADGLTCAVSENHTCSDGNQDTFCPELTKCCNGSCIKAEPAPSGSDLFEALQCRDRMLAGAEFFNKTHFCETYVLPIHHCVFDHTTGCDNDTLTLWNQNAFNFIEVLEDAYEGCSYDVCDGKNCGLNGECRSLLDQPYEPFGEGADFFKATSRRLKFGYYCECYPPYEGTRRQGCNELGCSTFDVQVDLSQLMVFQGRYEQNFTGLGPGYLSSDNMYLMIIQNRTRTFYSASDTVLLVQIDQTDESEEIIFVHESLNASNIVGMNVDFSSTSCSAGSQLFSVPIDQCFAEFGLTRRMLEYETDANVLFFDAFEGRGQRVFPCRDVRAAIHCILGNISQCFNLDGYSGRVFDELEDLLRIFTDLCRLIPPYGVCPEVAEPDCTGTEAENVTLKHCYIDDNCDTDFHKCCSPTCRLAAPPQPGALDLCRLEFVDNAVCFNKSQYCEEYVLGYRRCIERHTESCSNLTLNEVFDNENSFNQEWQQILVATAACQSDPCDPNPCQSNGTCIDSTFPSPMPNGLRGFSFIFNPFGLALRETHCLCQWPFEGHICQNPGCRTLRARSGLHELRNFSGTYELGTTPLGVIGYISRNNMFFMQPEGRDHAAIYSTSSQNRLLSFDIDDEEETIIFVSPDLRIDNVLGEDANFRENNVCLDGQQYLHNYGSFAGDFKMDERIEVTGYSLSHSVKIGCSTYNRICMYLHGFIAFTNGDCPPVEEANFAEFPPFDQLTFPQFAAFAGRKKLSSNGGVYFGARFSGPDLIRATFEVRGQGHHGFTAKAVYVGTWDRASPESLPPNKMQTNTYQFVLTTDFQRSFLMARHDPNLMNAASQKYFNVSGDSIDLQFGYFYDDEFDDLQDDFPYAPTFDKGIHIATGGNAYIDDFDWNFWFEDVSSANCAVTLSPCQDWVLNNASESFEFPFCDGNRCPRSELLAIVSGLQCVRDDPAFQHRTCYTLREDIIPDDFLLNGGADNAENAVGRAMCCYTKSPLACRGSDDANLVRQRSRIIERAGSLITSTRLSGFIQIYNPRSVIETYIYTIGGVTRDVSYSITEWVTDDLNGYKTCCVDGSMQDCRLFHRVRQTPGSLCFRPRLTAFMRGDPHITTLDGQTYTFNGLGEYVLLTTDDDSFELQARTARVSTDEGGLGNATKFSGIVMHQPQGPSTIQVELDDPMSENATMLVFNDGTAVDPSIDPSFGTTSIRQNNPNVLTVTFAGGWVIEVQVSLGLMLFVVTVPEAEAPKVKGLMGTPNKNTDDDFQLPDGTIVPINSTTQEIFHESGEMWRTTAGSSRFTYNLTLADSTWDTYNDMSFVSVFAVTTDNAIVTACGDDALCAFDFQQTGNEQIAMDTANANENFRNDTVILSSSVPTLSILNGTTITLESGMDAVLIVELSDADGDTVTLETPEGFNASCLTINGNMVTIDGGNLIGCDIALIAVDSNDLTSEVVPVTVVLCPNCVNGFCNVDTTEVVTENLQNASCSCDRGWTGPSCEDNIDACASRPCGNMTCVDLLPHQQDENNTIGYRCEAEQESVSPSMLPSESETDSLSPSGTEQSDDMQTASNDGDESNATMSETSDVYATATDPSVQSTTVDVQPSTTVVEPMTSEAPIMTTEASNIGDRYIRLRMTLNVSSARCMNNAWLTQVDVKLTAVHEGSETKEIIIERCIPGSAIIIYAIRNPTAVTDQDRAAAASQLLNAIDPTTNSIVIAGEPNPLSGSPVLLLEGDSKEVPIVSSCSYYSEEKICQNGGYCEVDDQKNPVCRCGRQWKGEFCQTSENEAEDGGRTVLIVALSIAGFIAAVSMTVVVCYSMRRRNFAREYRENNGGRRHTRDNGSSPDFYGKTRYHNWYKGWNPAATWMKHQAQTSSTLVYTPIAHQGGYVDSHTYAQPSQGGVYSTYGLYGQNKYKSAGHSAYSYGQYGQNGYKSQGQSAYSYGYYG